MTVEEKDKNLLQKFAELDGSDALVWAARQFKDFAMVTERRKDKLLFKITAVSYLDSEFNAIEESPKAAVLVILAQFLTKPEHYWAALKVNHPPQQTEESVQS